MTESLAVEWGPYGIRVNGPVPGCSPRRRDRRRPVDARPGHAEAKRQPAWRVGKPHELGWAATYLARLTPPSSTGT